MPISDDLHHRSLVTKLLGYERIVSIPNRCFNCTSRLLLSL
jgi:hypothetical protein